MIRHDDDSNLSSGTCYTLYLEYLGGLVPLLKGKRTSKIRPEFVIFDPQVNGESNRPNPLLDLLLSVFLLFFRQLAVLSIRSRGEKLFGFQSIDHDGQQRTH